MRDETVSVSVEDDLVRITFDDPETYNAIPLAGYEKISRTINDLADDPPSVVTIRGEGGHFSAGGALGEVSELVESKPLEIVELYEAYHACLNALESLDAPIVAALEGYCLGGGLELALACDVIVATTEAQLGHPETGHGLVPDIGGPLKLPGIIGEGMTKYLVMTGRFIDGERAHELGLVHELAEPGEPFEDLVAGIEADFRDRPTYAVGLAKRQVHSVRPPKLEQAMEQSVHYQIALYEEEETIRRLREFDD